MASRRNVALIALLLLGSHRAVAAVPRGANALLPPFGQARQNWIQRILFAMPSVPSEMRPMPKQDPKRTIFLYVRHKESSSRKEVKQQMRTRGFEAIRELNPVLGNATISTLFEANDFRIFLANLTRTRPVLRVLNWLYGGGKLPAFKHSMTPVVDAMVQIDLPGAPTQHQLEALRQLKLSLGNFADVSMSHSTWYDVLGSGSFTANEPRMAFFVPWKPGVSRAWTQTYWEKIHAPAAGAMIPRFGISKYVIATTNLEQPRGFDSDCQGVCFQRIPPEKDFKLTKAIPVSNSLAIDETMRLAETAYPIRFEPEDWRK